MKEFKSNITASAVTTVNSENTAISAGSGSLQVFGTPFMIALMEKATCTAVADILEADETTVGTKIDIAHSRASGMGTVITATALLSSADGRRLTFDVSAHDDKNNLIGSGTIERYVVNSEKFMKRVES